MDSKPTPDLLNFSDRLYLDFQTLLLKCAPRPHEFNKEIITKWVKNPKHLKRVLKQVLVEVEEQKELGVDSNRRLEKFTLCETFNIKVSEDYEHNFQLANFARQYQTRFYSFNPEIIDKNFDQVGYQLIPGRNYSGNIWVVNQDYEVALPECLEWFRDNKVLLTGAQGLSVVRQQAPEKFPRGKRVLSFERLDCFQKYSKSNIRVPIITNLGSDIWAFDLTFLKPKYKLGQGNYLFGLCEKPTAA